MGRHPVIIVPSVKGYHMKALLQFCLISAFLFIGCRDDGISINGSGRQELRQLNELEKNVVHASNDFGFRLLQRVNETETGHNLFISPLSLSMALGMTLNGAKGTTEDSMRSTLGFSGMTPQEINTTYSSLMQMLSNLDPKVQFTVANSIWYRLGLPVEQEFIETNQRYFGASVAGLDFGAPDAARTINTWVDENTKGKIRQIVDDPIPGSVVMYLINAIYFKGLWIYQFDKSRTLEAPFFHADGSTQQVNLMSLQATLPYSETPSYQAVELPYGDSLFSMIVVLPKQDESVEAFVSGLNSATWQDILEGLHPQEGTVFLPKFRLEYEKQLNDALTAMGMGIAFDGQEADFSGISRQVYQAGDRLFISKVKQKTFVQVDEEGTEAAAVTSVEIGITSVGPARDFVMRVDRPFFVVITERNSGTLLFVGKIMKVES